MKIALFKEARWNFTMPREYRDEDFTTMIRVTEWTDVEFTDRAPEDVVPEQVANIDKQIAETTEKFGRVLQDLKTQKANLLALTLQETVT